MIMSKVYRLFLFLTNLFNLPFFSNSYEPHVIEYGSQSCVNEKGLPKFCYPSFISAASDRQINASNTCGLTGRQKFCIHMSNAAAPSRCQYCDARNIYESHDANFLTDRNHNNWWQSETMDENPYLHFNESVTLTVDLGTQFHINYVYMMFKSPRPHAMVIHKKKSNSSPWMPWAYFSSNCLTYFGMNYNQMPVFEKANEVTCREEYSTLQPLYDGEVVFSVIKGRPGQDDFFNNKELQEWSTASQIKIELMKMHTFGDEMNAERATLLTYYFAIRKLTIGGRCICNGHGNDCRPVSGYGRNPKLVCVCASSHHVTGDSCEQCASGYQDRPWRAATTDNANECKACECNGNSDRCEFNEDQYRLTNSGGVCIGCGNNTHGKHCESCLPGHYPDVARPAVCVACNCDPVGSIEASSHTCSTKGQCQCKPGVGGKRCDRCLEDHHSFTPNGCQPCDCNLSGSLNNNPRCNPVSGECVCKANVAGKQCDSCRPGHFGLMRSDPLGCKKCYCSSHSSECSLGLEKNGKIVPHDPSTLVNLENENKVILNCPNGTSPCSVCLRNDKSTLEIGCNQNRKGELECLCRENTKLCPFCTTQVWREPLQDMRKEICKCPPQFQGSSCEECATGHRREPIGGSITSICRPCNCNNHSTTCDPQTGQCDCRDDTSGLFCDKCKEGYYGDPTAPVGSQTACQPCPCPQGSKCVITTWIQDKITAACTDCPNNRTGIRCENCAENFFGDPIAGIACKPCDCSGNTDLRASKNCDSKTGECKKCLFGTTGPHCEKCLPGHRRNIKAIDENNKETSVNVIVNSGADTRYARGCQPCQCDLRGTLAHVAGEQTDVCDEETGQCPCKPGVTGLRCDVCRIGFYGFDSGNGCAECKCSPIGSRTEICDVRTGACDCLPRTLGRTCSECQTGYYNLSINIGCSDCACHPYGSTHRNCENDGQCPCRSFAVGKKCDQCEENRYNLHAGCLPCPPCYSLIQTNVHKLRSKLDNTFGENNDKSNANNSQLYDQMIKLNKTVQEIYKYALDNIGVNSAISNPENLNDTISDLIQRINELEKEIRQYLIYQPKCANSNIKSQLTVYENDLNRLQQRINGEAQTALDKFNDRMIQSKPDPTLTEQAKNSTTTISKLKAEVDNLGEIVKDTDSTLRSVLYDSDKVEQDTQNSFERLNKELLRLKSLLNTQKSEMKNQLMYINKLSQEQRDRLDTLREEINKVPEVASELSKLESIMNQWQTALNKSTELDKQLENETPNIQNHIEKIRKLRESLQNAINRQTPTANEKQKIIHKLELFLNQSEYAITKAQDAVDKANQQLSDLNNFKLYVDNTRAELESMGPIEEGIEHDLNTLENEIQGIDNQVATAFSAAESIRDQIEKLNEDIENIKNQTKLQLEQLNKFDIDKDAIEKRLFKDIQPELEKSTNDLDSVQFKAKGIVDLEKKTSEEINDLQKDAENLLIRMNQLKDKITNTGPELDFEGDGALRFKSLKDEAHQLNITGRMNKLRAINKSISDEQSYLKDELNEFEANAKHISRLIQLLPELQPGKCFYSGKVIEGNARTRRSLDNNYTSFPHKNLYFMHYGFNTMSFN